jgi:hypothetical protein
VSDLLSPWDWTSSDWAGLTFLVLVVAAFVAWRQVKEAQRLREEQARPFVVIDIEPWNPFVDLKITNLGQTMARDVQFQFDPPLTSWKDERHRQLVPIAETNLFKNGIASFPPRKQISLWFDRYPDRVEHGFPDRYDVRISYRGPSGRRKRRWGRSSQGKRYSETMVLDLGMYRDIGEITRYGIHDVHNRLKAIGETLKSWTHQDGLKVLTPEDRKRYTEELRAEMEQRESAEAEGGTADDTPSADDATGAV